MSFGIYVHYPYCARLCPYCDFNVAVRAAVPQARYRDAVLSELQVRATEFRACGPARTVYFGGGTPGMWPAQYIGDVLDGIRAEFGLVENAEITVEFNPEDGTTEAFSGLARVGVNRISLGAQSFNDTNLKFLGRQHRAADITRAVSDARAAGIRNLSLDLIHGLDGQGLAQALGDLRCAMELEPEHISTYQLTIEDRTAFGARARRGEVLLGDEPILLNMFTEIRNLLTAHGYAPYEISSAALPGFESRHNRLYWTGADYLGLGAGAHGFRRRDGGGVRWENIKGPDPYMNAALAGRPEEEFRDRISPRELWEDLVMTGLRMDRGVAVTPEMQARFGTSAARLATLGLLNIDGQNWAATPRGRVVLDYLILELLSES